MLQARTLVCTVKWIEGLYFIFFYFDFSGEAVSWKSKIRYDLGSLRLRNGFGTVWMCDLGGKIVSCYLNRFRSPGCTWRHINAHARIKVIPPKWVVRFPIKRPYDRSPDEVSSTKIPPPLSCRRWDRKCWVWIVLFKIVHAIVKIVPEVSCSLPPKIRPFAGLLT